MTLHTASLHSANKNLPYLCLFLILPLALVPLLRSLVLVQCLHTLASVSLSLFSPHFFPNSFSLARHFCFPCSLGFLISSHPPPSVCLLCSKWKFAGRCGDAVAWPIDHGTCADGRVKVSVPTSPELQPSNAFFCLSRSLSSRPLSFPLRGLPSH